MSSLKDKTVTMAHGAGGRQTSELIDQIFAAHFANPDLTADDAAVLTPPAGKMAVSTDGFIVSPAFFPGGNIGKLSICGTVNDLACMGAKPLYLTCAFVIEEGFPMEKLEEIASAMEKTAAEAGVHIVSGDTKVAGKGQVDGVFITTTGMGQIEDGVKVGGTLAQPGDAIIVTGDVGRHGCTILLAREDFGIEADVTSDCAPLWKAVEAVMNTTHDLHVIRDATRGGVGTVLYEIAGQSNVGIRLDAASVPVAPEVKGVCGMLGLEPLYLACEGRMVIMAPKAEAEKIVETLRQCPYSKDAAIIGEVTADQPGKVVMTTEIGTINPKVVGKTALYLSQMAGFCVPASTKVLIAEQTTVSPKNPYSREKLCPVLGLYVPQDWKAACHRVVELLTNEGLGHTLVIHTRNQDVIRQFSLEKPVNRILINTPAALGGIGATTNISPALTLGCGAVGGGSSSDNVGPMNLLNIRKVGYGVRSIDELRAPGSRPEPQPTIVSPASDPQRSILDDLRFNAPANAAPARSAGSDDRFASAGAASMEGEINEQNVERVIRQVLERLAK